MTCSCNTLHERRSIPSFIIRDVSSQQQPQPSSSHHDGRRPLLPLSEEVTSLERERRRINMTLTSIQPPFHMIRAIASSSSDVTSLLDGSPRRSSCDEDERAADMFQKNSKLMTMSPQSQLLEIITEVLDLINDDIEDHHFGDNVSSCF